MNKPYKQSDIIHTIIYVIILLVIFIVFVASEGRPQADINTIKLHQETNTYMETNLLFNEEITMFLLYANVNNTNNSKLGISGDNDKLDFGRVPKSSIVRKFLSISNTHKMPSMIYIRSTGNISDYISAKDNETFIETNSTKEIEIAFNAKEEGSYEGKLYIISKTPKNMMISKIMKILN